MQYKYRLLKHSFLSSMVQLYPRVTYDDTILGDYDTIENAKGAALTDLQNSARAEIESFRMQGSEVNLPGEELFINGHIINWHEEAPSVHFRGVVTHAGTLSFGTAYTYQIYLVID